MLHYTTRETTIWGRPAFIVETIEGTADSTHETREAAERRKRELNAKEKPRYVHPLEHVQHARYLAEALQELDLSDEAHEEMLLRAEELLAKGVALHVERVASGAYLDRATDSYKPSGSFDCAVARAERAIASLRA